MPVSLAPVAPIGVVSSSAAGKRLAVGDGAVVPVLSLVMAEEMSNTGISFNGGLDERVLKRGAVEGVTRKGSWPSCLMPAPMLRLWLDSLRPWSLRPSGLAKSWLGRGSPPLRS